GTGFCAQGYCCDQACASPCNFCNIAGSLGTCSTPGGLPGNPSCGAYLCAAGNASCPTSCTNDNHCTRGNFFNCSTSVSTQPPGMPCPRGSQCSSSFCVSGVCCGTACTGDCAVCNVQPGTCTNATQGAPGSPKSCSPYVCSGASSSCPMTCTQDS